MKRRNWTLDEDEVLRQNYRQLGARECSELLGLTLSEVYGRSARIGLSEPMVFVADSELVALLREHHPRGLSDREICVIAREQYGVRVDRHRIGDLRRSLGLCSNACSEHRIRQISDRTREQLAEAGESSLAGVRRKAWGEWKRNLGWPESLTIRAVQALEMLWRHGPLTRIQLCDLLGVSSKKRTAPHSNAKGGTVLAELSRAGLVLRIKKCIPIPFTAKLHDDGPSRPVKATRAYKTKYISLYFLNPGVKPNDLRRDKFS